MFSHERDTGMNVIYTTTIPDLVAGVNTWLADKVGAYKAKSLYIPWGDTPQPIYADWRLAPPAALRGMSMIQLDEVQGKFAEGFKRALPGMTVILPYKYFPADLGILGLGMNGHVAFHEPGTPRTFLWGPVRLHEDTAKRLGLEAKTEAWTVGLEALLRTKALLLIIRGPDKWEVFQRACAGDNTLPVYHLIKDHKDLTVLTDQ